MPESIGKKWQRERRKRIEEIAPQLALIMDENTSVFNWGDYIITIRDMMFGDLLKRELLPSKSERECCGLKGLWLIAIDKIDKFCRIPRRTDD